MDLTELSKRIQFDNASKGFDPTEGGIERYLLLAISEICEAQNELRDGHVVTEVYYEEEMVPGQLKGFFVPAQKPCGFPSEIADAIIRLLDIGAKFNTPFMLEAWDDEFETIDALLLYIVKRISSLGATNQRAPRFRDLLNECVGRLWTMASINEIDIRTIIEEKLAFNQLRPPKHGRKF